MLVLAHLRQGDTYARLAAGFGHGIVEALTSADAMTFAGKGYQGAEGSVRTPFTRHHRRPALSRRQKAVDRSHAKIPGMGERAVATLNGWKILTKLRCCPAAPPRWRGPSSSCTPPRRPLPIMKRAHGRRVARLCRLLARVGRGRCGAAGSRLRLA